MLDINLVKVPISTIIFEAISEAKLSFPGNDAIFNRLADDLMRRYSSSKVLVDGGGSTSSEILMAINLMASTIKLTAETYIPIINFQMDNLEEILSLDKVTTGEVERIISSNREEAPSSDTSIRKLNETPNAGANPNLLDDTYLSESERNTLETGLKEVSANDNLDETSRIVVSDNPEKVRIMATLNDSILNYYYRWSAEINKLIFVI